MKKIDKWCSVLKRDGKPTISGGAARNVRIAESGGMDNIISDTINYAFNKANLLSGENSEPTMYISNKENHKDIRPLH